MKTINDAICAINNPDGLSNEIIQSLGAVYLQKHPGATGSYFGFFDAKAHTNQPVARRLKHFNLDSTAYDKWMFLADAYKGLKKSNGELSYAIHQLFTSAFGQPLSAYLLIHQSEVAEVVSASELPSPELVSRALKTIVNSHYFDMFHQKVVETSSHSSIDMVDQDVAFRGHDLPKRAWDDKKSAYDNWMSIAATPGLSKSDLSGFKQVFERSVPLSQANAADVSIALKAIVREHFAKQYHTYQQQLIGIQENIAEYRSPSW